MKKQKIKSVKRKFIDEDAEWVKLTPAKRFLETTKLWKLYIALGGSLDPEPNPQSPFYEMIMNWENDKKSKRPLRKELGKLRRKHKV
ncbi:MAG: hypothetical protein KAU58_02180 [Candidatus Omnitrophica bacterium]|nr:hypothetical protein [Candidatus Omnitrophota bacterium]